MKMFFTICTMVLIASLSSSFSGKTVAPFTSGVFSVCSAESLLKLELLENGSFSYVNHTDPKNLVEVTGNWTLNGREILLESSQKNIAFHNKWKLEKGNKAIKSRLGMAYFRLGNQAFCNDCK